MKVQFINDPEEELFDTVIGIDKIIFDGAEIGHAYRRQYESGERFQVVMVIITDEDRPSTSSQRVFGYGESREIAFNDALINSRKKLEITVQKLATIETKITGVEIHEQKEEPNTSGRILS